MLCRPPDDRTEVRLWWLIWMMMVSRMPKSRNLPRNPGLQQGCSIRNSRQSLISFPKANVTNKIPENYPFVAIRAGVPSEWDSFRHLSGNISKNLHCQQPKKGHLHRCINKLSEHDGSRIILFVPIPLPRFFAETVMNGDDSTFNSTNDGFWKGSIREGCDPAPEHKISREL